MPKVSPLIPTELVLKELEDLHKDILLIPEQVSMLIGISTEQMKANRNEGNPPPFTKEGGSIRYRVGDVRDYLKSKPVFKNEGEAHEYAKRTKNIASSFSAFLIKARLDDSWPFAMNKGMPVDLFASLSMPVADETTCAWLTLEQYLIARLNYERKLLADNEGRILQAVFDATALPRRDKNRL